MVMKYVCNIFSINVKEYLILCMKSNQLQEKLFVQTTNSLLMLSVHTEGKTLLLIFSCDSRCSQAIEKHINNLIPKTKTNFFRLFISQTEEVIGIVVYLVVYIIKYIKARNVSIDELIVWQYSQFVFLNRYTMDYLSGNII